jgi:hypothetical protein
MKLLEVRAAIRRATKEDLFTGDLDDMNAKQAIKDNTTVFYLHPETNQLHGPIQIYVYSDFLDVYRKMSYGKCGIIIPMPEEPTNEFIFNLVMREASIEDLMDTPIHLKLNRMYYTYSDKMLTGPLYIDHSITREYLEKRIAQKEIFIPNERQHFKKREYTKPLKP